MYRWTIYGKNGSAKAVTDTLELHDEWMAECFVTLTIKSAAPVEFGVGDYIDYRGERYTIEYDPTVLKKARRGSYGEGFTYENIKFVSIQDEIVRCDFNDIVLSDNKIHFTLLATFGFYCETADDLLDRIQANLEELYPGGWTVISPVLSRDRARGICVGREQDFLNAYERYIGSGTSFDYEVKSIALTVDNITCWDALKLVNEKFELNFIIRERVVIVGSVGLFTSKNFRYGKGNGLYEIERIGDPSQQIVTRLRAYGAETNLPDRYYATINRLPFAPVSAIRDVSTDPDDEGIFLDFDLGLKAEPRYFTYADYLKMGPMGDETLTSGLGYVVTGQCDGISVPLRIFTGYGNIRAYFRWSEEPETTNSGVVVSETDQEKALDFIQAISVGKRVYFTSGVKKDAFPDENLSGISGLPDNMAINRLMLPGFPSKSLQEWVIEHMSNPKVQAIVEEGFTFSADNERPYIDSPNNIIYGIRPATIYFDGSSDDTEDIHPTIEGMTYNGVASDRIVTAEQIADNGVLSDEATENERLVEITIPYAGFELDELWQDNDTVINIKDGMCGGRDFKVTKQPKKNGNTWICTCERAYDETLKLYYPYSDFQIHGGDKFVLTGINLPDSYVEAAAERLFFAAVDALRKNQAPRLTWQPRIDEIWMQRQHDTAVASGGTIKSLHDTLKAGDVFVFSDEDLRIDASIIIDVLTIKENGNNGIPTYDVTLRDEKVVSTIEKIQNKISSISGGAQGGYSSVQNASLLANEFSNLFLSKITDDEAHGVIGFLRGVWFGTKEFFIDAMGNLNLNDAIFNNTIVNGLLKAYNAIINSVRSINYTGDGMLDTGWKIWNDYEGGSSKAVFDYLYVRKKAFFEELEIRRISYIGGNFCLSPASGRIWRIEGYDANGNVMGYDEYTVPWTLGGRIMMLFSHNLANRYLGHRKRLSRRLTDDEKARMKRIRCYMYSDDGSTSTIGNWTVGAQARCQTFNIDKQMEFDGSSWTGTKVGNTFWWRLVDAVGKARCDDGKEHYYVDFLCNTGSAESENAVRAPESDLPSVGDVMVQMGHRTNMQLANVIMLETYSDDAPAIKEYRGINSWNLTGKMKTKISPKTGNVFYAPYFHIETEYGDVLIPKDRGAWSDITPDGDGRRCYYYDRVSHNGSLWLCIVNEGSYTVIEPGDGTAAQRAVWQKQVEKGEKGETSFKSTVFKRSASKPSKPTGGSFASPVPSGWSDGIPSGTDSIWMTTRIFSSDGEVPQQSAWTDVQLMSDTESFDVEFSPVEVNPGNPTDNPNNWYDPSQDPSAEWEKMIWMAERTKSNGVWGAWKITKIKGEDGEDGKDGVDATNTALKYTGPFGQGDTRPTKATYRQFTWTDDIPASSETKPDVYVGLWEYQAGTVLDITTTQPKSVSLFAHYGKTGDTGASALTADLSNEMDSVAMTYDGAVASATVLTTTFSMYYGATKQTLTSKPTVTGAVTGVSVVTTNAGLVTVTVSKDTSFTNDKCVLKITGTCEKGSMELDFTIHGVRAGRPGDDAILYKLVPSVSSIIKTKGGGYIPSGNVTCDLKKFKGNTEVTPSQIDLAGFKMVVNGGNEVAYAAVAANTVTSSIIYRFYANGSTTNILERESVPLIQDGTDGTSPYFADIDNEMDSVACDSTGKTTAAYNTTVNVNVWHGSTAQALTKLTTTSATGVTITPNRTDKTIRFQVASGTSIAKVNKITITIASSDSGDKTLYFTLNGVRAGADGSPAVIYSLVPSVSSVAKKKNGTYSVSNVSCTRQKNVGGTITNNVTDGTITYKLDGGTEQSYTNNTDIAVTNFSKSIQFIFKVNSVIVDTETIPMIADGTDGTNGTNGTNGEDGTSIVPVPNSLVITQEKVDGGSAMKPLSDIAEYIYPVARDGAGIAKLKTLTISSTSYCDARSEADSTYGYHVKITGIWKLQTENDGTYKTNSSGAYIKYTGSGDNKDANGNWIWKYAPSGSVTFLAKANTGAGELSATITVPFACNLIGTYYTHIEDDMKEEVAEKVTAEITDQNVLTQTNFSGKYNQSSQMQSAVLTTVTNELNKEGGVESQITATNSRISTAEQNLSKLTRTVTGESGTKYSNTRLDTVEGSIQRIDGDYYVTDPSTGQEIAKINSYSTTAQTAAMISQSVTQVNGQTLFEQAISSSGAWEQGGTGGEATTKTYEQIKSNSGSSYEYRIRTKTTIPIGEKIVITIPTGMLMYVHTFNDEGYVLNDNYTPTGPSWGYWRDGTIHTLRVGTELSASTASIAILLRKTSGNTKIEPAEIDGAITVGDLNACGIDISAKQITLHGNTEIDGNLRVPRVESVKDGLITTIEGGRLEVRSTTQSKSYGVFEVNSNGEVVLQIYDKDGLLVVNLGGSGDVMTNGKWITTPMRYLGTSEPSPSKANFTANAVGASTNPCTNYYQMILGNSKNTGTLLKMFLPVTGAETTNLNVKDRDQRFFTTGGATTYSSASAEESDINSKSYITNGWYIKQNNGSFMMQEDGNVYMATCYRITSGSIVQTKTFTFTS